MRRALRFDIVAAILLVPTFAAAQDPDFSASRLEAGREAYREGRYADAVEQFRIASFGLLDRPVLLSESLARLAVANDAAGRQTEAGAAIERFLDLESRFPVYSSVVLDAQVKARFHALLLDRVPASTLARLPGVARGLGIPSAAPRATAVPPPAGRGATTPAPVPTASTPGISPRAVPSAPPSFSPRPPASATITRASPSPTVTASATASARPTATASATATPIPPSATATRILPSATATRIPPSATATATPVRPTATATATLIPPSATPTRVPPTATSTPVPPTATPTASPIPPTNAPSATRTAVPTRTVTPSRTAVPTRTATRTATSRPPTATRAVPTSTPTRPPRVVPAAELDRAPRVVRAVPPIYPREALRARIRGVVVLDVLVSESGAPLDVRVVQGARGGLSEAAVAAVKQWQFEPGSKGGSPVRTWTRVQIPFEAIPFATPVPASASPLPPTAPPITATSTAPPIIATPTVQLAAATPTVQLAAATPTARLAAATPTARLAAATPTSRPTAASPESRAPAAIPPSAIPSPWSPEPPTAIPEVPPDAVYRTRRLVSFGILPGQARLFVDGTFIGIAEDWSLSAGGVPFELARRGPHRVRAELPGYRTLSLEIDVTPAAEQTTVEVTEQLPLRSRVAYTRLPRPDVVTRDLVELRVQPAGTSVSINGRDFGSVARISSSGPLRLPGPAVHELTFSAPGRRTRQARVLVSPSAPSERALLELSLR